VDYDPFLKMVKVGRCRDHGSVERKFREEGIGRAMAATPELERVSHHEKRE
jgi:hypothetical protein